MCESRALFLACLTRLVSGLEPEMMTAEHAKELVGWFSRVERLAAAGKLLCAGRVAATGSFADSGQRSAASWLAHETGGFVTDAMRELETESRLRQLPVLEEAFRSGELSPDQVAIAAGAAAADPTKEQELLEQAKKGSVRELRTAAERIRAAARSEKDEQERYEAVKAKRSLRWWTDSDGAFRLDGRLTPDAGKAIVAELEPEAKRLFKQAGDEGRKEPFTAAVADALVNLVTAAGATPARRPSHSSILRVDLAALRRGKIADGEICEIPGVGPVPLARAREILGESFLKLVITDGVDVQTVCHAGRHVSSFIETALFERDQSCVVPGCDATAFLERDHWRETFADGGPTDLPNLCLLCSRHHHLKHNKGFTLRGGPGNWEWIAPTDTAGRAGEQKDVPPWREKTG
jgi:hypothetical protein